MRRFTNLPSLKRLLLYLKPRLQHLQQLQRRKSARRFCISVDISLPCPLTPSLAVKSCLGGPLCLSLPLPTEGLQRLFISGITCDQPSGFLGQEMRKWMLEGWNKPDLALPVLRSALSPGDLSSSWTSLQNSGPWMQLAL